MRSQAARRLQAKAALVDEDTDDDTAAAGCFSGLLRRFKRTKKPSHRFAERLTTREPASTTTTTTSDKRALFSDARQRIAEHLRRGEARLSEVDAGIARLSESALQAKQRGALAEARRMLSRRMLAQRNATQLDATITRILTMQANLEQLEFTHDIVAMNRSLVETTRALMSPEELKQDIHDTFSDVEEQFEKLNDVNGLLAAAISEAGSSGTFIDENELEAELNALGCAPEELEAADAESSRLHTQDTALVETLMAEVVVQTEPAVALRRGGGGGAAVTARRGRGAPTAPAALSR